MPTPTAGRAGPGAAGRPASIRPTSAAAAAAARWNIRASFLTATARVSSTRSATRLRIGQRVWLFNGQRNGRAFGTAAEYISLAEHLVTPLPDRLSFAQGATLGIPAMTAWTCLFCDGPIVGKTVLVTGGAGAVGHYAAVRKGGARHRHRQPAKLAAPAGADLVVNYRTDDVVAKNGLHRPAGRRPRRRCRFRRQH
jgi:NADPH:quinone reductase-like Zn-dependent oxidoreductase